MKMKGVALILFVGLVPLAGAIRPDKPAAAGKAADDFWNWRAKYAPFTGDDVNRIERPAGSAIGPAAAIDSHRKELEGFRSALEKDRGERMAKSEPGSIIG